VRPRHIVLPADLY